MSCTGECIVYVAVGSDPEMGNVAVTFREAVEANVTRIAALEAEVARLISAIERDRSTLANFITALKGEMDSRFWLTEGRGSYAWDDDRYRQEFREAAIGILSAIKPLEKMAADLTNSPRESAAVRDARRDLEAEVARLTQERDAAQADRERLEAGLPVGTRVTYDGYRLPTGMIFETLRGVIDAARKAGA